MSQVMWSSTLLDELGYVAFALDIYGEVATSHEQVMALIGDLVGKPALPRRRAAARLDVLKAQPGVDPTGWPRSGTASAAASC